MSPIVLLGGEVGREKLYRLRAELPFRVEWAPMSAVATVVRRMKAGDIGAIVLLHGLVNHSGASAVMRASRLHAVPLVYAARAACASLTRALDQLRGVLGIQPHGAGGPR